jgi:peptide deformylase
MAILPILEVPDPRLRRISEPVAEVNDAIRKLIADMFETMYAAPGIGLAAAQVDVPIRLLVMDLSDGSEDAEGKGTPNPRVYINPEIIDPSDEHSIYNEGCLSVPDQYADVERPATVRARWLDEHGVQHDEQLDGLTSTCLQHEMDHLDGIIFIDHLSRLKRGMIMKKLEKLRAEKPAKSAAKKVAA